MQQAIVFPRDLCVGDVVLDLQDNVERVVRDVWYASGFKYCRDGKTYGGLYSIEFEDSGWVMHMHDQHLEVKRDSSRGRKPKSAVSIFYGVDKPKSTRDVKIHKR